MQTLEQKTEVFQGVEMCKGESQSVVTIRIDDEEVNLYGKIAAHYDMLLRNRADQAKRIDELEGVKRLFMALDKKNVLDFDDEGWELYDKLFPKALTHSKDNLK